ncbi:hypothetical protein QJQ45_024029 [Haematococcus lacustris]|nr:hypothetical protein QJQ45_024029 [Haematococcus lacustris]
MCDSLPRHITLSACLATTGPVADTSFFVDTHRYGEQMRAISLRYVPTAVLSRQTAGIRGKALVINLPGKPKSIRETFDEVFKSIPYCIQLAEGPYIETVKGVVDAFRPPADKRAAKLV